MKKYFLLSLFQMLALIAISQSSIQGKITDEETGEELIYANIVLSKNGVFATGTSTDFDGNYSIPIDPGTYEVKISYTGYPDKLISDVIIKHGQANKLDVQMIIGQTLCYCFTPYYTIPLIQLDETTSETTISSEKIKLQSTKEINQLILNTPGVSINN